MNVAQIIIAHSRPSQLKRLVDSLTMNEDRTFVHLDKKCNLKHYEFLKNTTVDFVTDRHYVNWGGFSQVKAIVASIRHVLHSGTKFKYLNLISGQDYPLKPLNEFHTFLEENPSKIFIDFFLPGHQWLEEAKEKIANYHLTDYNFQGKNRLAFLINRIVPPRKLPTDFTLVGHSSWFTLDWQTAAYLVDFFDQNISLITSSNTHGEQMRS